MPNITDYINLRNMPPRSYNMTGRQKREADEKRERNAILEMLTNQGKQISNRTAQLGNTQTAREMARYGNPTYERTEINGQQVVVTKDQNGKIISVDSLYDFTRKNKGTANQPSAAAPVQNLPIFGSSPVLPGRTQTRAPIGKTGIPYTGPSGNQSPVQQFLYEYTKGGGNEQSEKNLAEIAAKAQQSPPDLRPQWARPKQTLNPAQERLAPYLPAGLDPYQATARDWVKAKEALDSGKRSGGRYTGYNPDTGTAFDTETNQIVMMPESQQVQSQRNEEKETALAFVDAKIESKDDLLDTIKKAQEILSKDQNTLIKTTAGLPGIVGFLPQTDGFDLQAKIDTIEANLAFDRLDEMRAASKTGGALGAVSEKELLLLKSSITSLNRLQSAGELANGLEKVYTHYSRFIDALAAARQKQMGAINPAAAEEEWDYDPATGTYTKKK